MDNLKKSFKELKWYEWIMIAVMFIIAIKSIVEAIIDPINAENPLWLSIINFFSAICGIFCIFFTAKANISNFIFAVINTIVYAIYLWFWKILGTFYLEVLFYMPMNFVTWYYWVKHRDEKLTQKTKTKKLNTLQNILVFISIVVFTIVIHYFLSTLSGDSWFKLAETKGWSTTLLTWIDSSTFSIGVIATILELLRYKEQYVWWIVVDILAVLMYILHFDLVYLTKKTIYLIMAIIGLSNWSKLNIQRNKNNE